VFPHWSRAISFLHMLLIGLPLWIAAAAIGQPPTPPTPTAYSERSPIRLITAAPEYLGRWYAAFYEDGINPDLQLLFEPFLQAPPDSVACSPDSTRVATNANGIDVVDVQAGVRTLFDWLLERDSYGGLDWSPVENRLAYHQASVDSNYSISVLDLDTLEITLLIAPSSSRVSSPRWSSDGTHIVYVDDGDAPDPLDSSALWLMNADGTNRRPLTAFVSGEYDHSPDWSPRGGEILFVRSHELMLISEDGAHEQVITPDLPGIKSMRSPLFAPDGQQIAFIAQTGEEEMGIFVMDRDGSNVRYVRDADQWEGLQCWLSSAPPLPPNVNR
jgi:dipeptidyl aminopeptidase/acylaminoacyl peptidase